MANCPKCGSDHIQLTRETNVNWGRALGGWVLFGVVGGAVGAVTGEDRTANACLDCGTTWKAKDLYTSRQLVKQFTGKELDLSREKDREFLNAFLTELTPYIERYHEAIKQTQIALENPDLEVISGGGGCLWTCLIIGVIIGLFSGTAEGVIGFALFGLLVGVSLSGTVAKSLSRNKQKSTNNNNPVAPKKMSVMAKQREESAKKDLEYKVRDFLARHLD